MKQALTIAGSDSGAGAGIQADLKTFHAHGVYGTSVVTAVTAQNTNEVIVAADVPAEIVDAQIEAVTDDFDIAAVKTGMLPTEEIVEVVAHAASARELPNLVVDPVAVSTAGDELVRNDAFEVLRRELLPLAFVVTPNVEEAERLAQSEITSPEQLEEAARAIHGLGCANVVITGGHTRFAPGVDVWFDGERFKRFEGALIDSTNTHGTGCTFSAAITARLARGEDLSAAIAGAKRYTAQAIAAAPGLGSGHGPTNHFFFHQGDEADRL